ncbi:hypothetical protein BLOT_001738 [Blomia tropicalis]|nr:hypothetical protein BLOT_001738 [Blomia tropicalis]
MGESMNINGPVFIENSFEPKGKAIQKLEFFIRIVELCPTWLESGSEIFKWYEAKRAIISVSMSSNPPIDNLDRIMAAYMEITLKAHFLTHHNELIRFYGKLQPYSTTRYERKNGQNKKFIKHSKNFRNTVYSMAHLHQDYAAISAISEEGTSIQRKDYDAVPAELQPFSLKCNIIRKLHYEELYVKPENFFYLNGSIHVDGKLYKKSPFSKSVSNCNELVIEVQPLSETRVLVIKADYASISAISEEDINRKDYDAVPAELQPFSLKCNIIRKIHNEEFYAGHH